MSRSSRHAPSRRQRKPVSPARRWSRFLLGVLLLVGMLGGLLALWRYTRSNAMPQGVPIATALAIVPSSSAVPPTSTALPLATANHIASLSVMINEVVAFSNQARRDNGCDVMLVSNPLLNQAAQSHSEDMARRGYFDHLTPEGRDPGERITATGYRWSRYGENIAGGYTSPAEVVEGWMHSPGHRANLLNCEFREIGVGYVEQRGAVPGYEHLWTQVFATAQ